MYRCGADGVPAFVEARAPTDDELHALPQTVITRPALSDERVQLNAAGQVALKLKAT